MTWPRMAADPKKQELDRVLPWVKENCREGREYNPPEAQCSRAQKDQDREFVVKIAIIARDPMVGNPRLGDPGYGEEALGRNAIGSGFQGQRHWTDRFPNGDSLEAILKSSFDWNGIREPFVVATENDRLNRLAMLLGHLLTNTAQVFADVRTYWSPAAVKQVTGRGLSGGAKGGIIHLINSGAVSLDATGLQTIDSQPAMKPFWETMPEEVEKCLAATAWHPAITEYFRGGGFLSSFMAVGGMKLTTSRINLVKGLGPVLQIAEGHTVDLPADAHHTLDERTNPTWPTHWFVPRLTNSEPFRGVYSVMCNWGANHGALGCGQVGADLITLASMLRSRASCTMCPRRRYSDRALGLRSARWTPRGADFRACANFGPCTGHTDRGHFEGGGAAGG